ncbi:MAG TPA: iron uptake transporter permease EfeU [Candidatus Limnocylindrales bacterium]
MNPGSFSSGLLTGLREGVEAALIVSIILAYLSRTGNGRHAWRIWLGAAGAVAISLAVGVAIFDTTRSLPEQAEQLFSGSMMLIAAGVVTWMLFWMRRQAAGVKGDLQARVDRALTGGSTWALAILAFTAVIREGIETSLFLVGQANSSVAGAESVLIGALGGLAIAVLLGYGFYRGSRRVNLAVFFRWTGIALVFIAAGLLSHAIHELIEAGVVTIGTQTAYDIRSVLPDDPAAGNVVGQFLGTLFGYSANPELATIAAHLAYLVAVLALYLRPMPPRAPAATPPSPPSRRSEAAAS